MIELQAEFAAEFVQSCVVTLDPVGGAVSQRFALLYGPPEKEAEAPVGIEDDMAFEPLVGDAIDVGEAVAQEFLLALPPFPRSPDAAVGAETPAPANETRPFAVLSRLLDRQDG